MKRIALIGILSVLFISSVFSQGDPKRAYKKAKSKLGSYQLDQANNYEDLLLAKKLIDFAAKDSKYGAMAKTHLLKGQIYNALAGSEQVQRIKNPAFQNPVPDAALTAYKAFNQALQSAEKKYQKSDALEGLANTLSYLSAMGVNAYQAGDFKTAYDVFNKGLEIHKLLKDKGKKSPLDNPEQYNNQVYITALAALNAGETERAGVLFEQLRQADFDKPEVYDGLYKVKLAQKDTVTARELLAEGRKKYPDNKSLMYSEINDYLFRGKMEELVDKLKAAIQGDPKNVSLHATLGTVYDQLSQSAREKGKTTLADEYFNLAKASYEKALELKPDSFEAIYSLGALYYNKAAAYTKILKSLENDMSKAGIKKYDDTKKQMDMVFEQALPYFLKADKLNPKDQNTLIALKEIYARKNNAQKAKEYSDRLAKLQGE